MILPATTDRQLQLLERALGVAELDDAGRARCRTVDDCPRNFVVVLRDHADVPALLDLAARGLMVRADLPTTETELLHVTPAGLDLLRARGRMPAAQRALPFPEHQARRDEQRLPDRAL